MDGKIEKVYRTRYRQFLRVATAIVGNEPSAHDAIQDGFAHALRAQRSFRADGSLEGWIWSVVVNAALAARRTQLRRSENPERPDLAVSSDGVIDDPSGVRRWVATLPERQRLAVYLRYYADLDYRGIATALGVEIGTVSATLNAAHQTLRRSLQEVEK